MQVPFGTFEEVLKLGPNREIARRLEENVRAVTPSNAHDRLHVCRELAMEVGGPLCFARGSTDSYCTRHCNSIERAPWVDWEALLHLCSAPFLRAYVVLKVCCTICRFCGKECARCAPAGDCAQGAAGRTQARHGLRRHPCAALLRPLEHGHVGAQGGQGRAGAGARGWGEMSAPRGVLAGGDGFWHLHAQLLAAVYYVIAYEVAATGLRSSGIPPHI